MVMDLICKNNGNEQCDTGKDQISMQGLLILGAASCKTEMIFDVIDISFNNSPDLIGVIPFIGSTNGSGIGTQVSFGININHAAAFG